MERGGAVGLWWERLSALATWHVLPIQQADGPAQTVRPACQQTAAPLLRPAARMTGLVCRPSAAAGDYSITESQSYDPVIAAIPLMVLAGLAAFLAFYLAR